MAMNASSDASTSSQGSHIRWGNATSLAVRNFQVSELRMDSRVIAAVALIKAEAAIVNSRSEPPSIDSVRARAIRDAAIEIVDGLYPDQFPIDVFQTGSGTSTNMNVNEVIAHRAHEATGLEIHPNDHVNASQSSNDVMPSAMRIAVLQEVNEALIPAYQRLERALQRKTRATVNVVKAARTHLMDAVPMMMSAEFDAYHAQVVTARTAMQATLGAIARLPLGGTAAGTGLNAVPRFGERVIRRLSTRTGIALRAARPALSAQASHDDLLSLSAALRTTCMSLVKISNDLRWMNSGPSAGLSEIRLAELQPGSSIMPGKVNPVIPEVVVQVCARVIGNDATVAFCCAQGNFELNVTIPIVAHTMLDSVRLLANAMSALADCIATMEIDERQCRLYAEASPAIATALNGILGYDAVAELVHQSEVSGVSVIELAQTHPKLRTTDVAMLLDVDAMALGDSGDKARKKRRDTSM